MGGISLLSASDGASRAGVSASITQNSIESPNFQAYEIHLLIGAISSLITLLSAICNTIHVGTNLVTMFICGLFHCIGEWYQPWF